MIAEHQPVKAGIHGDRTFRPKEFFASLCHFTGLRVTQRQATLFQRQILFLLFQCRFTCVVLLLLPVSGMHIQDIALAA